MAVITIGIEGRQHLAPKQVQRNHSLPKLYDSIELW